MYFHAVSQVSSFNKLFASFAAWEQFFSGVYSHMTVQLPCSPKPFPAFTACKWFFSCVYFQVSIQVSSLIKLLTILAACKWLFSISTPLDENFSSLHRWQLRHALYVMRTLARISSFIWSF